MLQRGAVGHNHFWFHRDAIEAFVSAADAEGVSRHVAALEHCTRNEPLPWVELCAARGRALALLFGDGANEALWKELSRVRAALQSADLTTLLPALDAAMAS